MISGQPLSVFQCATTRCAWQIVNDGVMGGLSSSSFQLLPGGTGVFSGIVSLDNGGGFASVWSPPLAQDCSGHDSFVLRIRGDGHRFKFSVRQDAGFNTPIYRCAFETKPGEWQECRLPFTGFVPTFRGQRLIGAPALDPTHIASIGFLIADKQAGPFRLEIDLGQAVEADDRSPLAQKCASTDDRAAESPHRSRR
jgi:monofunctional biosynthetic peptidoglycan transglycosylase